MLNALRQLEAENRPIRVALVGAGAMGIGIAWQVARTPGMRLVAVTDLDLEHAQKAADAARRHGVVAEPDKPLPSGDAVLLARTPFWLDRPEFGVDVVVEATNTIAFAGEVCQRAIARGCHVILMNAEVDLALGPLLYGAAEHQGVVITSDAGDQHGVLLRMIDEIQMWAFDIKMAGNIKGFLDRHATAESLRHEAQIRNLNPVQCCAYTDGTKLNIEMALVANATDLLPWQVGMEGPAMKRVEEVFQHFDFTKYGDQGVVDYILGAEPGGGVFVVGHCDDATQMAYLKYYKLGDGPFYLFYRPYHLCHLETTRAIALAALYGKPVMRPVHGRLADVYAYAKRNIEAGELVPHGIGGNHAYGQIDRTAEADPAGHVPIALLEAEGGAEPRFTRSVAINTAITYDDVLLPDGFLQHQFAEQARMLAG